MNNQRSGYLPKLASLRFVTAFWVVIYHMGVIAVQYHNSLQNAYSYIYAYGYAGVSIFFVLSGFVISYANENWKGWRKYLTGRVTRIYPSHWIVTFTIGFVFILIYLQHNIGTEHPWLPAIANLTLTQAWIPDERYYFSLNAASWSLSAEMFFYVSFIFLRRLQDRYVYILTLTAYTVLVISALNHYKSWNLNIYWDFFVNPVARLPEFLVGMSIYRLHKSNKLPTLPFPRFNFIFILAAMMATLATAGAHSHTGGGFKDIFTCSIIPIPFIILIMISLADDASNEYMRNKILVLLGESSFALYLMHRSIINYSIRIFKNQLLLNGIVTILFMCLIALVSVGMSVLFYKFIELPITRRLRASLAKEPT